MVTIDDIARAAKVSTTTVSNVVNGRANRVSKATMERINRIIDETGYVPNLSARALVSRSSKVVALLCYTHTEAETGFLASPFTGILADAVERTLRQSGYYLMVRTVTDTDELLLFLRNWNIDGLFLLGELETDELRAALLKIDKPIVLCDSYLDDGSLANVGLEDEEGSRLAVNYLLKAGHRRIAFACPKFHPGGVMDKRLESYRRTLEEADIKFDPSLVMTCELSAQDAEKLGASITKRNDVTAVFAAADLIAAGVMAGIRREGRRVPEDYSIIGFDDLDYARLTSPTLTTVRQNTRLKGQLAADLMASMLEDGHAGARNIKLPVHLVERGSVRVLV